MGFEPTRKGAVYYVTPNGIPGDRLFSVYLYSPNLAEPLHTEMLLPTLNWLVANYFGVAELRDELRDAGGSDDFIPEFSNANVLSISLKFSHEH
jgi:hypothetical protein